jgi:hypothetical protein
VKQYEKASSDQGYPPDFVKRILEETRRAKLMTEAEAEFDYL